jgi:Peptidase A4 family
MAIHTLADGMVVTTFPPPPAGFNLSNATDSERARFGIPRFAPGSNMEKRRSELLGGLRIIEPAFLPRERRRKALPQFKPDHAPDHPGFTTQIWSGGITTPADGDRIWDVNGTWNIPEVAPPVRAEFGVTYTASTWIGIDGYFKGSNSSVLQAGCDADVTTYELPWGFGPVNFTFHQFNPWFEWYPGGSHWITNLPAASSGDEFMCWIQCLPLLTGSGGANSALVFLANLTGGFGLFFVAAAPGGITLQGGSAEWIVEALKTGPQNAPELAEYTPVTFNNCRCVTVEDKLVESGSGSEMAITDASNQVISQGELVGSDTVQVFYI